MVMVTSVRALDPALLRRAAAVVRGRGHIANGNDAEPGRGESLDGGLAAAARTLHPHVHPAKAQVHGLAAAVLGRHGGGERRGLLGALEAGLARRSPGEGVAPHVGDRDEQVVERRRDVGDAFGIDHFLGALGGGRLGWSGSGHLTSSSLSSCRRWPDAAPSWCARWCGYAGRGPAVPAGGGCPGSCRYPSAA